MPHTAEIFGSSIVAAGAFNPAILSPDWLEMNGLIGDQDAELIRTSPSFVVSRQVCVMETDWFAIQVLENQFSVTSKDALSPAIRDLAVGILSLLPQTPVSAVGLNFIGHFRMPSMDEYYKFGDVLAPKTIWKEIFHGENTSVGIADLTIRVEPVERGKESEANNVKRISIQPSPKVKYGIFILLNDHRVIHADTGDTMTQAEYAAAIINDGWKSSWEDSVQVFDELISKVLAAIQEQAK